jgi:hypothetical protein
MGWRKNVDYVGEVRNIHRSSIGKFNGMVCLFDDLGVDGNAILKWIVRKQVGRVELDSSGSCYGPLPISCEYLIIQVP